LRVKERLEIEFRVVATRFSRAHFGGYGNSAFICGFHMTGTPGEARL
jgi:hypothetical protein